MSSRGQGGQHQLGKNNADGQTITTPADAMSINKLTSIPARKKEGKRCKIEDEAHLAGLLGTGADCLRWRSDNVIRLR